ncbi:MAG: DUF4118 domain-containing protein, partial [Acidobacteriota bacterium]
MAPVVWGTGALCFHLHANRLTTSMALLMEVLGVATLGDQIFAALTSVGATLAVSWYYIDQVGSLNIVTAEGWITFLALLATGLGGSRLAVVAQQRAHQSEQRRLEMERLQALGQALIGAGTWREAADTVVLGIVNLFGMTGAVLRGPGRGNVVAAAGAARADDEKCRIDLGSFREGYFLELQGAMPSTEVAKTIGQMAGMALDRARQTEESARMEGVRRG